MISWLFVIILAYFFFSIAFLGDKLVLAGPPKPKSYTFFVGIFGGLVIFLLPFIKLTPINAIEFGWAVLDAIVYLAGLYAMFSALEKFEVSKVAMTIGATQPMFILALTWLFWGFQAMAATEVLAFAILLAATFIISADKSAAATGGYLKITILASVMFSLDYAFQKFVFLSQPFLQGLIWIRALSFLIVLLFLLSKKFRMEIFQKKTISNKKTRSLFLCSQVSGGLAGFLQSAAIFLAPVGALPIINSLRGIQYVFLFVITLAFSFFFPKILREKTSPAAIIKKVISIIFIVTGLAILILY